MKACDFLIGFSAQALGGHIAAGGEYWELMVGFFRVNVEGEFEAQDSRTDLRLYKDGLTRVVHETLEASVREIFCFTKTYNCIPFLTIYWYSNWRPLDENPLKCYNPISASL